MQFRVLGPLEVDAGDGPIPLGGPKQRAVLANLLVRANEVVPADTLIADVWGEDPPDKARNTLQTYVSNLRRSVGNGRLQGRSPGYVLVVDPPELDAARFDALVREAKRSLPVDPAAAVGTLEDALALWRGPALADLSDQPSLVPEATRLDELRAQAEADRIEGLLAGGSSAKAVGELESLVARYPLRERLWELLMLALYREGRQAEALGAYQRARELLADELGVDPSPELSRLQQRILAHDAGLDLRGEPLRGYRLLETIGEGSFGVVHRALQPHVGREVAVKVVAPALANDPAFVRRFEADAQVVARLEHPHIVPLYDYWRDPEGAYLVMRYVSGGSLRRRISDRGPLATEETARILEQIGQALATAHRLGVIHRNVKPENVLLDDGGNAYLSDFGIARDTSDHRAIGAPASLAPEQIRGERPTPQTDVHGLGVTIFGCLTGRPAFEGGSVAAILDRILHQPLPSVRAERPELPAAVDDVIARATAKEPALRYPDVLSLVSAFGRAIDRDAGRVTVSGPAPNPYKGLRPFLEADAGDFFGRDALVDRLVARLGEEDDGARFLGVVGPSGSGKSSAVRAGLIPALRAGALDGSRDWFYLEMAPGPHPLDELGAALGKVAVAEPPNLTALLAEDDLGLTAAVDATLPADGSRLLLVVDQLEETFTLVDDESERRRFLDRLAEVDPRVTVVATLRADFYDRPLTYQGFGELLAARTEAVPVLSPDELEQAIRAPAEQVGVQTEPGMIAAVIADVTHQPGALPLVQYALTEAFDHRTNGTVTLETYREIGGVTGALSARADRIYESSGPEGRSAIRQVFLRLVTLGEGREDTRRLVTRAELDHLDIDRAVLDGILEDLGRHRLLTFDREPATREPTVEIAHEALLGAWERLHGWIDDAREDLRSERRLARSAAEWKGADRDPSFLLRGARLEQVESWAAETDIAVGRAELAYLKASRDEREAEHAVERTRIEREARLEHRSVRRLRGMVAVFAVAALVAASLTIVATRQSERAERASRIASTREIASAAISSIGEDPELAVLLAMEAVRRARADGAVLPEALDALHRAVAGSRIVLTLPNVGQQIDWSPQGVFATEHPEGSGTIDIRDDRTGDPVTKFPAHHGDITNVAFSPDGSMLATTGIDGFLRIWSPTGELLSDVRAEGTALEPVFRGDGTMVAATWIDEDTSDASDGGSLRIVDPATGRVVRGLDHVSIGGGGAFGPDGTTFAFMEWNRETERFDGRMIPIDRRTPVPHAVYETPQWVVPDELFFGPDRDSIVGWPWIWDTDTGESTELVGPVGDPGDADWSQASDRLVTGSVDGTARVWEISGGAGQEVVRLSALGGADIVGVALSPEGDRLMTTDVHDTLRIWDVGQSGDAEWGHVSSSSYGNVGILPDGEVLGPGKHSVIRWDLTSGDARSIGEPFGRTPIHFFVPIIDASADGKSVAVIDSDRTVVWDSENSDERFELPLEAAEHIDWHPHRPVLAATDNEGRITIYDEGGKPLHVLPLGFEATAVRFSPDGRLLAASGHLGKHECEDPVVQLWDWEHERVVQQVPSCAWLLDFQGNDRLVTAGYKQPIVWDVESGSRIAAYPRQPANEITDIEISPDGATLALTYDDKVRLFDTATREPFLVLRGHTCPAGGLAFSVDGSMLASRACDGIRIWAMDVEDLLEIAQRNVTRTLTDAECRRYLHVERCPGSPH